MIQHGSCLFAYLLATSNFCAGTPFEAVSKVYVNAWIAVKRYITTAAAHGIAMLASMHALPGGANNDAHSGTDSRKAGFRRNEGYHYLATSALVFMAKEAVRDPQLRDWVFGIPEDRACGIGTTPSTTS